MNILPAATTVATRQESPQPSAVPVVLERLEVPHAKVNSIGDLLHDPHLTAVEMFPRRVHPTEGPIRIARAPFLFDDIPLPPVSFAEELGASTGRFRAQPAGEVGI